MSTVLHNGATLIAIDGGRHDHYEDDSQRRVSTFKRGLMERRQRARLRRRGGHEMAPVELDAL